MNHHILKLLSFQVSGIYAHFKKFYTNSSSLSYLIPPRTVIIGMLASVLEYKRDSYYSIFDPQNIKISTKVTTGTEIKKQIQSMNYLRDKYFSFLCNGTGDPSNMHTQCKLELLIPVQKKLEYTIYVGAVKPESLELLNKLEEKMLKNDFGYGIYLGQRPFRAYINKFQVYSEKDIRFKENINYTDTLFVQENGEMNIEDERNINTHLIVDQMPVHMQKENSEKAKTGRTVHSVNRIAYEKLGKRVYGNFKNGYQVEDKMITFFEG